MAFKILSKNEVFKGKYNSFWETRFLDKNGNEGVWEWMKKKDFVSVLAITKEKELVIIKQYRISNEKYCYQTVAGQIDATDKNPEDAAKRELMEETGYEAEKLIALAPVLNAPGSLSNTVYPFIALDAYKVNDNRGDATEDIEVVKIPMEKLYEFYTNCPEDCDFSQRIIANFEVARNLKLI